MQKLAIHGGPKAKPTPYSHDNRYGFAKISHLVSSNNRSVANFFSS